MDAADYTKQLPRCELCPAPAERTYRLHLVSESLSIISAATSRDTQALVLGSVSQH